MRIMNDNNLLFKTLDQDEIYRVQGGSYWKLIIGFIIDGWADIKRGLHDGAADAKEYMD